MKNNIARQFNAHVIPSEENDYTPRILKHRALLAYGIVMILLKALLVAAPIVLPSVSVYSSAITPENIVLLTNQTRRDLALPELTPSAKLAEAARAKAEDMSVKGYFAHTSPEGKTPWSWIRGAGYRYETAGENLAIYFVEAEDVQAAWLASPSHRANMVNPKFSEIGIGVAAGIYNGHPAIFVAQMFGRPSLRPTSPPPTEPSETSRVAKVIPKKDALEVSAKVQGATAVRAHLGSEITPLTQTSSGEWSGTVPYDKTTTSPSGDTLSLLMTTTSGTEEVAPIALVAPQTPTQALYAFTNGQEKSVKLFNFLTVDNLQDRAKSFYFLTMLLLGAALLINIFVKIHIQRPKIIAHSIAIIALAFFLTLI